MLTVSLALVLMPILMAIAALEGLWLMRRHGRYDWGSYWASMGDVVGRVAIVAVLTGGTASLLLQPAADAAIVRIGMDRWWHWVALVVGVDALYYWMHRAEHRVHWFWLSHSVHHSPNDYTLSAAYRLGWTTRITGNAACMAPLVLIGFPLPHVLGVLTANLTWQFWLHTELIGTLPRPLEYVLNTPAHHRVHHASNPDYIDCNYGGIFIVFDRLFGTFRSAQGGPVPRYGLVHPLRTHNPVRIALHAWVDMARLLRSTRTWRERIRVVLGPPEYVPPGARRAD